MGNKETVETDVLVVGGGYGGCMAAISACEHGVKVTVVEKAHVEQSGAAVMGNDHFWHWDPASSWLPRADVSHAANQQVHQVQYPNPDSEATSSIFTPC